MSEIAASTTPIRVLLMEDEDDQRRLYARALSQAGFQIDEAATVEEARSLLDAGTYDFFICDIRMGNERGTDLIRERGAELMAQGTQIIVLSAQEQYRAACEEMGVEFFFTKPVSLVEFITVLKRLAGQE